LTVSPDVVAPLQEAEDCNARGTGVPVTMAVLGDDEAAFVLDADEVAGAHSARVEDWLWLFEMRSGILVDGVVVSGNCW